MKAKEVLELTGITRAHLSKLVKQGKIKVTTKPNGQYIYNVSDVYKYAGKERQNLNLIYVVGKSFRTRKLLPTTEFPQQNKKLTYLTKQVALKITVPPKALKLTKRFMM